MDWLISSVEMITELRWYVAAVLGTSFFTYYLREAVKHPVVACSNGKFRDFLYQNVPIIKDKYWPTFWCFEPRLQTVFASVLREFLPNLKYRREILTLKDGGEVGLDWQEEGCSETSPIIILLPGLTGTSQTSYIKCLVQTATKIGVRTVVFNNRGLAGVPFKTPRTYSASSIEDLTEVVAHVRHVCPHVPLAATGISMGGSILGNYIAKEQKAARESLSVAMIISVPWDVNFGTASLEEPVVNRMINNHLAEELCTTILRDKEVLAVSEDLRKEILKCRTVREVDSCFTAPRFGFKNVWDYYNDASLHEKLDKIQVPLLCLSAADDPFQPLAGIPVEAASKSKCVAIVVTARGGHIGFMEGALPILQEQYMCRIFRQFFTAAFQGDKRLALDAQD